ncbi:MAG: tetratricopeptide repeat protein, partial [Planctomyces sp.]
MNDSVIRSLREALSVSPDNIPLRKHLAQSLMSLGQAAEAESEWQQLLRRQPGDAELMLGLAECYLQSGKYSASIVSIEELVGRRETSAATYLLHARLLLQRGDVQFAV